MEKTETNNSINQEQKSNLKIQSFDISLKEKLFSIEISIDEKKKIFYLKVMKNQMFLNSFTKTFIIQKNY